MTYTIHFTDNTKTPFTIDEYRYDGLGAINGQHTSLTLLGKGYSDYGQELWTNLVHMLENHSDVLPPPVPIEGQLWYDNSSITNLKICKKAQGGGYKWIDIVDTETLQKLLYSSDFFSESILQANVRVPSGTATIDGNVHIKGKLEVDNGIYSYRAPATGNEVVTLSYLSSRLTPLDKKFVPLKLPTGTTTIDGSAGNLSLNGDFTVTGKLTIAKDPSQQTDATNKQYVDNAIRNGGVSWPAKTPKTVLVCPNGTDVAFSDITPEYICKTDLTIPTNKTGFNVIASDTASDTAFWINLDDAYVTTQDLGVEQEILGDKKFKKKVTLAGELHDSSGSAGTTGQVLTSRGPGSPPVWGAGGGGGGGGGAGGLPTLEPGVLTSDGTTTEWINGTIGQFLSISNVNTFKWVDIFGSIVQNDSAGTIGTGFYSRGYLKLPNDVALQWIVGKPIYAAADLSPAPIVSDLPSLYQHPGDFSFLSTTGVDIACKYKYELPFEKVFFTTVSTNITPLTSTVKGVSTTDINANGEYKTLPIPVLTSPLTDSSSITHAGVTLSIPKTTDKVNPKLSPVILSLGKLPNGANVGPSTVIISTNSDWTVPAGLKTLTIHLVGGGAGGGEGYVNDNWNGGGAGGGSGAYKIINFSVTDDVAAGDKLNFKIGVGGNGGEPNEVKGYIVVGDGGSTRIYKNGSKTIFKTAAGVTASAAGGSCQLRRTSRDGTDGGIGGLPGGKDGGNGRDSVDNGGATATGGKGGDSPIPYAPGLFSGGGKPGTLGKGGGLQNGHDGEGYGAGGGGASIAGKGTGAGTGGNGKGGVAIIKYTV